MRILFVTATRIGDAVLSTGILSHLVERYPNARLTIAAGPLAAPLFREVPGLERVVVVPKRRFALHWLGLYAAVAARHWDLAVDLRGSALTYMLWTRERRVMAKGDPSEHRVVQLARLFDLSPPPAPRLWLGPRSLTQAARLLPPGKFLAMGPAANWRHKEWRAERFAELALRLTSPQGPLPGAKVVVLAAAHERNQATPLLSKLPPGRVVDLIGRTDPLTAGAVLANAALFVGNDTGLMHVAAASGAPTLGLFGPSRVSEYAPWGPRAAFVQTATPYLQLFQPGWDNLPTSAMMDSLTVDMAEAGACDLLARVKGAAA